MLKPFVFLFSLLLQVIPLLVSFARCGKKYQATRSQTLHRTQTSLTTPQASRFLTSLTHLTMLTTATDRASGDSLRLLRLAITGKVQHEKLLQYLWQPFLILKVSHRKEIYSHQKEDLKLKIEAHKSLIYHVLKEQKTGLQVGPQSIYGLIGRTEASYCQRRKLCFDVLMSSHYNCCVPGCTNSFRNAAHLHFYRIAKEQPFSRFLPYCLRTGCPSNQSIAALRSQLKPSSLLVQKHGEFFFRGCCHLFSLCLTDKNSIIIINTIFIFINITIFIFIFFIIYFIIIYTIFINTIFITNIIIIINTIVIIMIFIIIT